MISDRSRSFFRALWVGGVVALAGPMVVGGLVDRAYRRLGARYPAVALTGEFFAAYPFIAATEGVLALYVPMSVGQFLRIFIVWSGFQLLYTALIARRIQREAAPITAWIGGARDKHATLSAWHAGLSLPLRIRRLELAWPYPVLAVTWMFDGLGCVYATWELGLPAYDFVFVFAASFVYLFGIAGLRFFLSERVLQPVVNDIAASLPSSVQLSAARLPLRWRLLVALPGINVISGVVAVGVTSAGHLKLADLGLAVLISLAIAGTISLVYTVLLSDSVTEPICRLRDAAARVGAGDFTVSVPVTTTDETGDLARSFNEMAAGLAERERIREAFGTYVDRDVAEHILREGTLLSGEEVEVTIMFIDIRDFTGFAERAPAPEVVATINRLFEQCRTGHPRPRRPRRQVRRRWAARRVRCAATPAGARGPGVGGGDRDRTRRSPRVRRGAADRCRSEFRDGRGGQRRRRRTPRVQRDRRRCQRSCPRRGGDRQTGDTILLAERTKKLLRGTSVALAERTGVSLKGKRDPFAVYAPVVERTRS